jgi:hypothetical protein
LWTSGGSSRSQDGVGGGLLHPGVPSDWPGSSRGGDDIAPIPGTKRVSRIEENTAADTVELSAEQIARLNDLTPATGERHHEANISTIDR